MAKNWDYLMKMLVGANRQDLVNFLVPGARYLKELNTELQSRTLMADLLYTILWDEQEVILHVEFQRLHDNTMGRRLWEYNAQTTIITGVPVCSFVIYLKEGTAQSPYQIDLPNKQVVHRFWFEIVKLWEIPATMFKQAGVEGLLPLLPLTKNGNEHAVVEDMIASLDKAGKTDLLPLGFAFAALVLKGVEDQDWLRRRFAMLKDILEESWAYQEMVAQGEIQGLREAIIVIIMERFPDIADFAQKQVNALADAAVLRHLIAEVSKADSIQQAREALSTTTEED